MIKYIHTTKATKIAYYYANEDLYKKAKEKSLHSNISSIMLMQFADFAIDLNYNSILKNRNVEVELLLDSYLQPITMPV